MYNKTVSGERLGDTQRNDFLKSGGAIYSAQIELQNQADEFYKKIAQQRGLNVEHVIAPFSVDQKTIDASNNRPGHSVVMGNAPNRPKLTPEQAQQALIQAQGIGSNLPRK